MDSNQELLIEQANEIVRLTHLCLEWEAKSATWLASPEAAQRLAGYREMGQRAEKAERQRDELLEALRGLLQLEEENLRGPDDIDVCFEVQRARDAIAKVENEK